MNIKQIRLQSDVIAAPAQFLAYYQRRIQQERDLPKYVYKFFLNTEVSAECSPDNLFLLLSAQLYLYMENDEFALSSLRYKLGCLSDRQLGQFLQLCDKFYIPPFADLSAYLLAYRIDRMSEEDLTFIFGPREPPNEDMARIKAACDAVSDWE